MSEKPDPRTRLVAETFAEEWTSGPAAAGALRAAARTRLRRQLRRAALAGAAATLALVVAFTATHRPAPIAAQIAQAKPAYETISEEQLLAAWGNRPVLILPGESPERRIVLLHR